MLVQMTDNNNFCHDLDCPVLASDVDLLVGKNPLRILLEKSDFLGDSWSTKWTLASLKIQRVIEILQSESTLKADTFESLCSPDGAGILYVIGRLWLTERFGHSDLEKAEANLKGALRNAQKMLAKETDFSTQEMAGWLIEHARFYLTEVTRRKNSRQILEMKAKADAEKFIVEANATAKEKQRMLSALSHTLHNSLVSGPEIIRTAVRVLGARQDGLSPLEHKMLNDLTSLHSTFELNENLIQSFKLLVSAPEKILAEVMMEQGGLPSIGDVVADTLRRNLASVLFHGNDTRLAFHLMGSSDFKVLIKLRAEYRYQLLSADELPEARELVGWVAKNLPGLKLSLARESFSHSLHNSTQHALLFVIISELFANSMKHADDSSPLCIDLSSDGHLTELNVQNGITTPVFLEGFRNSTGGLSFIETLISRLTVPAVFDVSLEQNIINRMFCSKLVLQDERVK